MNKPTDFFVGVIDLFGVILPGAALLFIYLGPINELLETLGIGLSEAGGLLAFVFASYVLGNFIDTLGSQFLGSQFLDSIYNNYYRKKKWDGDNGRGKNLMNYAEEILKQRPLVIEFGTDNTISQDDWFRFHGPYWWCDRFVRLQSPVAATEIDKAQADSKFFRNFIIVLGFASPVVLSYAGPFVAISVLIILIPYSLWRFFELRWKATQLTYGYFIALNKKQHEVVNKVDKTSSPNPI